MSLGISVFTLFSILMFNVERITTFFLMSLRLRRRVCFYMKLFTLLLTVIENKNTKVLMKDDVGKLLSDFLVIHNKLIYHISVSFCYKRKGFLIILKFYYILR
jgi:hypothetical protein